jgi:hypothetical protein
MKSFLVSVSVAFSLFAGALVAAPILTPEIAAAPPGLAPAAYEQQEPMVASDGHGFIAIWIDQRAQHPNGRGDLFAVHLDEQGGLLDPRGTRLAEAVVSAQITATAGGGYTVAAQTLLSGLRFLRLDGEGALLGQPMTIATLDLQFRLGNGLATNGTSYLLTGSTGDGQTMSGLLLDPSAQRKAVVGFSGQIPDGKVTILVIGGRYHALHRNYNCAGNNTPCTSAIVDDVIGDDGVAVPRVLTPDLGQHYMLGVATSGDRILLAWLSDEAVSQAGGQQTLDYTIVDPNGAVIAPRRRIFTTSTSSISGFLEPTVGWDGRNFLLTWQPYENGLPWPSARLATRITPDGVPLDAAFAIDRGFAGAPRFAHSSGAVATVWAAQPSFSDFGNAVARVTAGFDALVTATAAAPVISLSPAAETQPAVSVSGDQMLTVWREGDASGVIRASVSRRDTGVTSGAFDVSPPTAGDQHDPVVATMGGMALISWTEERAGGFRIRARRYSMALERFLDDAPLLLADQTFPPDGTGGNAANKAAVATNGAAFFVVWPFADRIQGLRMAADGRVLDAAPIVVAHELVAYYHRPPIAIGVIWTGGRYLVVWVEDRSPNVLISPIPASSGVVSARVTADGVALDAEAPLQLWDGLGAIPGLTLVAGSNGPIVAWLRWPVGGTQCLETLTLQPDSSLGSATPVPRLCDTDRNLAGLAGGWNGGGVTLVWSKGTFTRGLFSMRLNAAGEPIDSSPTELLPATSDTYSPAVAQAPSGVALTYVRVPIEPQYGFLGRVFTRTLVEPAAVHRRIAR